MLAHFLRVRDVPLSRAFYADIHAAYEHWSAKGAQFLTGPRDRKAELRCYMRDPDGYLIEVGQAPGCSRASSPTA